MRFLVVDDSSTMRRIIINTLNKLGYQEIVEASNGREGMDRLGVADVDMVITDWNMPEMNGIEFIRALRSLDKTRETPVLMVTTNAAKDDIVEALRAGVNNYIVKPFTPDTFKEKIAGSMLGMSPAEVNGEMPDAIGEITNMIAGSFRLKLAERGETLAISIPSVTVGSDFYTKYASDVRRVLCPFRMDDQEICVELILTRN